MAVRELRDEAGGGFVDRAGHDADIGLLRTRRKPFVANAEAARCSPGFERTSGDAGFHPAPKARCARRPRNWPDRDRSPRTTSSARGSSPAGDKLHFVMDKCLDPLAALTAEQQTRNRALLARTPSLGPEFRSTSCRSRSISRSRASPPSTRLASPRWRRPRRARRSNRSSPWRRSTTSITSAAASS